MIDDRLWVTILAGGIGSRFWPVSTPERPKQLLPLGSPAPLIVDTVERARALVPDARLRVTAGSALADVFAKGLPDLPPSSYLREPRARGTCPVLTWAAWELVRVDPDAVLVSLHSDHIIRPLEAFRSTVRGAAELAAREDVLVTIGVPPDRIETGYGHIQPGEELDVPGSPTGFRVAAFHEKPDAATAERYNADGFVWNTGIFVWRAALFLDEVRRHTPEVAACLPLLDGSGPEAFFDAVSPCVVDTAVLERSDRVACVRAEFAWDDVGSWDSVRRTREPDDAGNVVEGEVRVVEGEHNVVWAEDGEVVLWGLDDVVVVRTADRTLVMPRERAPRLKELLTLLEATP